MANDLKENEFKCAVCGGVFEKAWTDEESKQESERIWGAPAGRIFVEICDPCFQPKFASMKARA